MAKKQSVKKEDVANAEAPINQEIRLAEVKPGEIEKLEEDFDILHASYEAVQAELSLAEEINLNLEESLRRQEAELVFLRKRDGFWLDQMIPVHDVYGTDDAFKAAPISFLFSMTQDMEQLIIKLMDELKTRAAQPQQMASTARGASRKEQILAVLCPNNIVPGPPVTISELAIAAGTNNKNISSILTGVRDMGYSIATDEYGRKYVTAYDPTKSAKGVSHGSSNSTKSAPAATITPDQFISSVVKRSPDGTITKIS
jgi:hypothetical protein